MHLGRKKNEKQAKIRGKVKKLLPKGRIKYEHGQKKQEKVCPKGQINMHLGRKKIEKQVKI